MENNTTENRKKSGILIGVIVLLAILAAYFGWKTSSLSNELAACHGTTDTIIKEAKMTQEELKTDLGAISARYDSLGKVYTGLDSLFQTEKNRIADLEAQLKKTGKLNANLQKEYNTLKARQDDYIRQIADLTAQNQALTLENIQVKTDLQVASDKNTALTMKSDSLSAKVKAGSTLAVAYIKGDAIQEKSGNKEVTTMKARKADKLRCCFTVAKNTIATAGPKDFFLRVIDPSGNVVKSNTIGESGELTSNGTTVSYTTKTSVIYENENVETCIYTMLPGNKYVKGIYKFEIFFENEKVASTPITLN